MPATMEVQEPKVKKTETPGLPPLMSARPLFSDSLLEVTGGQHRRRTFSTAFSFVFQCILLGLMLLVPLMFTENLPRQQLLTFLVAPPPPPPPPPPAAAETVARVVRQVQSDIMDGQLRSPSRIPQKVQMIKEEEAPPPMSSGLGVVGGVPGGVPGGQMGGVIGGIISSTSNMAAVPKLTVKPVQRVRVSQGVTAGLLIRMVEPKYPRIAVQAHVQGQVLLSAIISRDGTVQNLSVISGHPLLVQSAIDAVKQWRYRPYLLNGEPVEVDTQITVNFQFSE